MIISLVLSPATKPQRLYEIIEDCVLPTQIILVGLQARYLIKVGWKVERLFPLQISKQLSIFGVFDLTRRPISKSWRGPVSKFLKALRGDYSDTALSLLFRVLQQLKSAERNEEEVKAIEFLEAFETEAS